MRIALEDNIIIEWSNEDNDGDSHIVEDCKTYKFTGAFAPVNQILGLLNF